MDEDLSLVTTEALVEELSKRFECMIFASTADTKHAGNFELCEESRKYFARGDKLKTVGLAAALQHRLLMAMMHEDWEENKDDDGDEDYD